MNGVIQFDDSDLWLLRPLDVAKALNISRAFAYRLMQEGKIRTVNICKSRRVRPGDLRDFINQNLSSGDNLTLD